MEHLPKKIHQNGISYTLVGDYYIPDLKLPEESRPIGRWGRMHKAFLQEHRPGQYNELLLSGKLWDRDDRPDPTTGGTDAGGAVRYKHNTLRRHL